MKKVKFIALLLMCLAFAGISTVQAQERGGSSKAKTETRTSTASKSSTSSATDDKCGDKCTKECCGKRAATKGHACSASCKESCCKSADNKRKSGDAKATHVKEMSIKEEGVPAGKGNNEK